MTNDMTNHELRKRFEKLSPTARMQLVSKVLTRVGPVPHIASFHSLEQCPEYNAWVTEYTKAFKEELKAMR